MHSAAKARTQNAGNEGQLRPATDDVQAGDVAAELTDTCRIGNEERFHRGDRCLNEGSGGFVEVGNRNRDGLAVDGHGDELRRRGEGLLRIA